MKQASCGEPDKLIFKKFNLVLKLKFSLGFLFRRKIFLNAKSMEVSTKTYLAPLNTHSWVIKGADYLTVGSWVQEPHFYWQWIFGNYYVINGSL